MDRILHALLNCLVIAGLLAGCGGAPTPLPTLPASVTPAPSTATPLPSATLDRGDPLKGGEAHSATLLPTVTTLPPLPSAGCEARCEALPAAQATPVLVSSKPIGPATAAGLRELARWGRGRAQEVEYSSGGRWLVVRTGLGSYVAPAQDLAAGQTFEGSLHFAPDEQTAAAVTRTGRVDLWKVDGWKRTASLSGLRSIFAPDGALMAVVDASAVRLIKPEDGSLLRSLAQAGVEREQFTQDGAVLVTANREVVNAWQISDGKLLKTLEYERVMRLALSPSRDVGSPDGSLLLIQGRNRQNESVIEIYKVRDWTLTGTISVSGSFVMQPDGARLFVYSNFPTPGRIESYHMPDGQPGDELRAGGSIYRLAVSPDSKMLAASIVDYSASNQQTYGYLKTFETSGKELKRLECGIFCEAQQPSFSPDGKLLAVAGLSSINRMYVGSTFLFDAHTGERLRVLHGSKAVTGPVEKIAFAPDGQRLAALTGPGDDAVRVWKVADGALQSALDWSADTLNMEDLARDGSQLAAFSDAGVSRLLKVVDGALVKQIDKAIEPRFGRSVDWVAAADAVNGKPEGVRLFRAANGETLTTFPRNLPGPLTFSPVDDLGVFFKDFSVQLIKLPSGAFAGTLTATGKPNVRLTVGEFSPDGKLLASGSVNGEVWLWQVAEKKQKQILEGHKNQVSTVLFSKDGSLLITGSIDGAVLIWQASDGKLVKTIRTAELVRSFIETEDDTFGQLAGLALSQDGSLIAASGTLNPLRPAPARQGVVLLLKVDDGTLLRVLPGGGGNVAFSPDGKNLIASGDGAVHLWGTLP